jgi:hypothetical protein
LLRTEVSTYIGGYTRNRMHNPMIKTKLSPLRHLVTAPQHYSPLQHYSPPQHYSPLQLLWTNETGQHVSSVNSSNMYWRGPQLKSQSGLRPYDSFLDYWLRLALSKRPNRVDVSRPSSENGNRPSFWNILFCSCLEYGTKRRNSAMLSVSCPLDSASSLPTRLTGMNWKGHVTPQISFIYTAP